LGAQPDLAWVCAQAEFEGVRREMEKEAVRAAKLEQRLSVLTKGYATREAGLRADIGAAWDAAQAAEQARMPRLPARPVSRHFSPQSPSV
jgi:hypothetical protein